MRADFVLRARPDGVFGIDEGRAEHVAQSYAPRDCARSLDRDLKKAGILKHIPGVGKLDFHALRTAFATMVIEAGATVKEAQTLLRHSTPQITLNTYPRTRDERLVRIAQRVGEIVLADRRAPKTPPPPSKAIPEHAATPCAPGGCREIGLVAGARYVLIDKILQASLRPRWRIPRNGRQYGWV